MKHIALTQRLESYHDGQEIRDCLDIRWSEFVHKLKAQPLILPTKCSINSYHKAFEIDGIILTGGNDPQIVNNNELSKLRDEFEFSLIKWAIENNIPVLGICRGMQIIALYFSGNLKKVTQHVAVKHELINKHECINITHVNSYHNYSIKELPEHFDCLAESHDHHIEAFQHRSHKIMGIMWHPERESPFKKEDISLFRNFFSI